MLRNSFIWIISLAIALTSGLLSIGAVTKNKAPALAITLSPTNGFAAENIASESAKASIVENSGQFPDHIDSKATKFAQEAFIAEPVTPEAVAVLALGRTGQDKHKLMSEALSLSRRQSLITAWMIADSGARKDIPALLNHYDTMMRTNTAAASVVIPLMADALANDNVIAPFASLLEKQPPWSPRFWRAVVGSPEALGNAARLREMLYTPDESDNIYSDEQLIRALIKNQQFGTAEALYHLLVGQRKEAGSFLKNGSFEAKPQYSPVDWQLFSTGEYGAVVTGGTLKLSAIRNSSGLFARQLVKLPKNVVKMDVKPSDPISDNAQIVVRLKCAQVIADPPQAIRIPLKREISNLQIDNSGSGCSFYWLEINGRASENGDGFDISLDSISIVSL